MQKYFLVEDDIILDGPVPLPRVWENVSGLYKASPAQLKALGWLPQIKVGNDAVFDPSTHKLTGPVNVIDADAVISTWTIEPLTPQEQIDWQQQQDIDKIKDGAVIVARIAVTLIDTLLSKSVIAPSDFDPDTRAMYTDFKESVDRLKSA